MYPGDKAAAVFGFLLISLLVFFLIWSVGGLFLCIYNHWRFAPPCPVCKRKRFVIESSCERWWKCTKDKIEFYEEPMDETI